MINLSMQMVIWVGEDFLESRKAKREELHPSGILYSSWLSLSRFLTFLGASTAT
jgi:hypothetical protein